MDQFKNSWYVPESGVCGNFGGGNGGGERLGGGVSNSNR